MSESPAAALADPTSSDPVPDLLESVIGISQYLSISYWVGEAINLFFDVNPFEWVAEQFAGDWEAVQKAGIAMGNLGEFSVDYSVAISSGLSAVAHDWQGNAADAANTYFSGLANTVKGQESSLSSLGREFKSAAVGMYETANAIKDLLETLLDLLIAIGLELAAAAATSWTIIGPILSGAAAAATVTKALGVWGKMLEAHSWAWTAAQAVVGVTAGYLSTLGDIEKHALPESNYDHPGA